MGCTRAPTRICGRDGCQHAHMPDASSTSSAPVKLGPCTAPTPDTSTAASRKKAMWMAVWCDDDAMGRGGVRYVHNVRWLRVSGCSVVSQK